MNNHQNLLSRRRLRPDFWRRMQRCLVLLGASLALALQAGCASAPGMQLDTDSAALRSRADLLPINADLLNQLAAQRRSEQAAMAAAPAIFGDKAERHEYRVAAQDVLSITVWNHPELTNPGGTANELSGRAVAADGSVFFPYVGAFKAAGHTPQEIRDYVALGLQKVIKNPQVDVAVLQYRGQRVYLSGEVRNPGPVAMTDVPPDLVDVLARAGGVTSDADLGAVTVTRGGRTARLNLQALYYGGDLRANIRLRSGDIVNVPERRQGKVFVTGEVLRPTAVLMPRGSLSLADALSEAGGLNPLSANAGQVYVLRSDGAAGGSGAAGTAGADFGRPRIYHLDAKAPDALLLADRFALNARDVVYVDTAAVVRWSRVVNNLLGSASLARDVLNDTVKGLPR